MDLFGDNRAQAIQVGAVLIFAIIIIFLSTYQAFVVPNQNEQIEFNHNQQAQQQMTDLRSNVILMPGSSSTRAASVDLGVRYPSRALFVNPGPVSGTLRTVGTENAAFNLTLEHVTAVDGEGETGDFWNGTTVTYNTGAIEYRPSYNLYQNAPRTVYEHSVLYNNFTREGVTQAVTGQSIIDGRQITLIALNGSLSESRVGTTSVDFDPVSTRARTVSINNTGDPITISLATGMSEDEWQNATLEDELVKNGGYVQSIDVHSGGPAGFNILDITLQPNERYQLELAKVGVGTGATETDSAYLAGIDGNDTTVDIDSTQQFTVEIRDKFNVPQSGIEVTGTPEGGSFTGSNSKTSGNDGQATFRYEAKDPGTHQINFTIEPGYTPDDSHNTETPKNVTMTVTVPAEASGGGGGSGAYNVTWQNPSVSNPAVTETAEDGVYDYDATETSELDLWMETDAPTDGAPVDFSVSDQQKGIVSPVENTTANSESMTTFDPRRTGEVSVYTSSGGSGDVLTLNITDIPTGRLDIDPNQANKGSVHNWSFQDVPFDGEVDNVTFSYPAGTDFANVEASSPIGSPTQDTDVIVKFTNEGASEPSAIRVNNNNPSGNTATFELSGSYDRTIDGQSWIEISDLKNPDVGTYDATLTFKGKDDTYSVTKTFTIGADTTAPTITSAAFDDTDNVINDSEANSNVQRTVTVRFNETMNTNVSPTISFENVSGGGNTYSNISGVWLNDTTFEQTVSFADNNVDTPSAIVVADAEDDSGNVMNTEQPLQIIIDTILPGDAQNVRIDDPVINISNEQSVTATLTNPSSLGDGEVAFIRLYNSTTGEDIVVNDPITTGAGGETTITGINVSSLPDGTVNAEGYVEDDAGNPSSVVQNDSAPKDTIVPTITDFNVSNPSGQDVRVTFNASEMLDVITVDITGAETATLTESDFTETGSGPYNYTAIYSGSSAGTYTATLNTAEDSVGNNAASGQSGTVTVGSQPSLASKIVDQGQTGSLARYEVSYNVSNRSSFDRVEVNYNNLDSGGADKTYTRTDPRLNIDEYGWTDSFGGTGGDTYEITIEVFDTNGNVVDSRTVTDDADGTNPSGNDDLTETNSPVVSDSALQDRSQNSNARYDVNYTVSDPSGRYTETEVLFYNRDSAYATEQRTGTAISETLSYSAGGAEGDTYDIVVQVQDDDGIVVDSRTVTDTADGAGFVQPGIVFAGESNGRLSTIDSRGRIARSVYSVAGTTAAGPQTTDFAFGPGPEVPYKDGNGKLGIVDLNGNKKVLVDTNYGPGINDVRLAVGQVFVGNGNKMETNGGPFVYFVNGNGKLTRVDASGTTNIVTVDGTQVTTQAVAGTGDIDADGSPELVFVDSNGQFDYIDSREAGDSGNFKATIADLSGSPTLNTPNAVGPPTSFDGDSAAEIPYIDGNKRAKYVNGPDGNNTAGDTTTLTTATGGEYPVGVADVAGDSRPEIIYVDTSGNQRLAYAGHGSISGFVTDFLGNKVRSATNPGAS